MKDAAKWIAALERELALERHRRRLAEHRATVLRAAVLQLRAAIEAPVPESHQDFGDFRPSTH
jgi:hypothetical protein